jgi:hypothetical protein
VKMSRKGKLRRDKSDELVCGMSSTRVGIFIEGLRMEFVIFFAFLNF